MYNSFLVYCRELAPGTVSLTGDRAQGDDNKHYSHYTDVLKNVFVSLTVLQLLYWLFQIAITNYVVRIRVLRGVEVRH